MFLNSLFVAKKQKYKEHTAACNPCLKRSVNKTKKQRAAGGCAGPVQNSATMGEWKEKQRVVSSMRTANVHCSSESTEMHTAETEFKKKKKKQLIALKEKQINSWGERCFCSVLCLQSRGKGQEGMCSTRSGVTGKESD